MESSERKVHVCCDCKARSPETDTNYTLISSRYGWRLSRHVSSDGEFLVEWRCPRCWERYKSRKTAAGETVGPPSSMKMESVPPPASDPARAAPPSAPRARRSSAPPARGRAVPTTPVRVASSAPPRRKK
jgi:hypothetical protein